MTESGKPRGRPFEKGRSGNPSGRPQGSRNRTTMAVQAMLDGEAPQLTQKLLELAGDGNMLALRMCFDRVIPPSRVRRVNIELPPVKSAADRVRALDMIIDAVTSGIITFPEAAELRALVEALIQAHYADEYERSSYVEALNNTSNSKDSTGDTWSTFGSIPPGQDDGAADPSSFAAGSADTDEPATGSVGRPPVARGPVRVRWVRSSRVYCQLSQRRGRVSRSCRRPCWRRIVTSPRESADRNGGAAVTGADWEGGTAVNNADWDAVRPDQSCE
jgi:hypothetical protein